MRLIFLWLLSIHNCSIVVFLVPKCGRDYYLFAYIFSFLSSCGSMWLARQVAKLWEEPNYWENRLLHARRPMPFRWFRLVCNSWRQSWSRELLCPYRWFRQRMVDLLCGRLIAIIYLQVFYFVPIVNMLWIELMPKKIKRAVSGIFARYIKRWGKNTVQVIWLKMRSWKKRFYLL